MAGKTTIGEIKEHLTLCDILDLHEALDIEEEINDFVSRKNKK